MVSALRGLVGMTEPYDPGLLHMPNQNSSLPGMCTIHANSAREAITKLCTLPLLAGENVSHNFVVPTVASSVDLVVHVGRDATGHRRVGEIVAVPGRVEGEAIETADLFVTSGDELVRAEGWPPHADRFERCGFDLAELLRDSSIAAGSMFSDIVRGAV